MNYRGVTANRQSKYNNSLNDDAMGNIAMQWGQLKVLLPLGGGRGGGVCMFVSTCEPCVYAFTYKK